MLRRFCKRLCLNHIAEDNENITQNLHVCVSIRASCNYPKCESELWQRKKTILFVPDQSRWTNAPSWCEYQEGALVGVVFLGGSAVFNRKCGQRGLEDWNSNPDWLPSYMAACSTKWATWKPQCSALASASCCFCWVKCADSANGGVQRCEWKNPCDSPPSLSTTFHKKFSILLCNRLKTESSLPKLSHRYAIICSNARLFHIWLAACKHINSEANNLLNLLSHLWENLKEMRIWDQPERRHTHTCTHTHTLRLVYCWGSAVCLSSVSMVTLGEFFFPPMPKYCEYFFFLYKSIVYCWCIHYSDFWKESPRPPYFLFPRPFQ